MSDEADKKRRAEFEEKRELLLLNMMLSRQELLKTLVDKRRDMFAECGYPTQPVRAQLYYDQYRRNGVAARVVELMPKACFQVQPEVYEDEDVDTVTEFEAAWNSIASQLRGNSLLKQERGNPIWNYVLRADIDSGIGQYGVILLGIDDGVTDLSQPVAGVFETNSAPHEVGKPAPDVQGAYSLTVNRASKLRKLLFMRSFPEVFAQITAVEMNPTSPRYGQPTMYLLTFNDPRDPLPGMTGAPGTSKLVHWTRCVHVTDDVGSNGIYSPSRLESVLNYVLNIDKIAGASPEGYWKACFSALVFETHPQLGTDVVVDTQDLRDQVENLQNSLQRSLSLVGMTAKTLPPEVVDPTPHIDKQIELVCINKGVPTRIFKGSERGELASTQDEGDWDDKVKAEQHNRKIPGLIVPLVDRLIAISVLPVPKQYCIYWPDITAQSAQTRATVAQTQIMTLGSYAQSGAKSLLTPRDLYVRFLGLTQQDADAILEAVDAASGANKDGTAAPSPLLSMVGGVNAMIELFAQAKAGAMSEDTLKQLIMLFYGVDEARATQLIADGLPEVQAPPTAPPPVQADVATFNEWVRNNCGTGAGGFKKGNVCKRGGGAPRTLPPALSEKAQRAKDSHKLVDKAIQRYAEDRVEAQVAQALGGKHLDDNEPADVVAGKHGVEVKTMVDNKNNKLTMKKDARERKAAWERKNKADMHTVVIDDQNVYNAGGQGKHDESKRRIYYRRGYGSFRVATMHPVKDLAELKRLMDTPDDQLPDAAKRPAGQSRGRAS